MNEKDDRVSGFKALLESEKTSSFYLIAPDGEFRLWDELSAEGRLDCIVRDAAYYDVPFEAFVQAVRESLDSTAIEEAALRLAMRSGRELHDLECLFPDDGRLEQGPPLVERVSELLNAMSPVHEDDELTQGEIAQARIGPGYGPEQESEADKPLSLDDLREEANKLGRDDRDNDRDKGDDRGQDRGGLER